MKPFTPDMSDDELDELFRKAISHYYSSDQKEEVWKKLEEKLNSHPPAQKGNSKSGDRLTGIRTWKLRWVYYAGFSFIILGILLWQFGKINSNRNSLSADSVSEIIKPNAFRTSPLTAPGFSEENKGKSLARKRGLQHIPLRVKTEQLAIINKVNKNTFNTNSDHKKSELDIGKQATNYSFRLLAAMPVNISGIKDLGLSVHSDKKIRLLQVLIPPAGDEKNSPGIVDDKPVNDYRHDSDGPKITHWYLGVSAGPDWSSVGIKHWGSGVGEGLKLTFLPKQNWAISTGIVLDKKLYNAQPENYNPTDNAWRNYDVKYIDASCKVIDFPLNLEYFLWNHSDHHIFIGTGMSSFWMREEKYTYHYKTPSGNWSMWNEELYNSNHYLFSILNFSAGYQRTWKNFSLELTPYLKVPLSGIGYGKVKLYSSGIHFTLQYGLR